MQAMALLHRAVWSLSLPAITCPHFRWKIGMRQAPGYALRDSTNYVATSKLYLLPYLIKKSAVNSW